MLFLYQQINPYSDSLVYLMACIQSNHSIRPTTIVVVQRRLTHYRVPFFEMLRNELALRNIRLKVLVGRGTETEEQKNDKGVLSWAQLIPNYYFAGGKICWQPIHRYLDNADLLVLAQENALLANHMLLLLPRKCKVCLWGHGVNFHSKNPGGFKERFKGWITRKADWFFAYTEMSANFVSAKGFPASKITVLNNSIDTSMLRSQRELVTSQETSIIRQSLEFNHEPVGVYLGSLYPDKRIEFLLTAADEIKKGIHTFQLLIIGDGSDRDKVRKWCETRPWAKWVGAKVGNEKMAFLSTAQVMLTPSGVGLGLLDSFASGVPMLTTDSIGHGPEISYLQNGRNGIMTIDSLSEYVRMALLLFRDKSMLALLREGCQKSAKQYTIENMVIRFIEGVNSSLNVQNSRLNTHLKINR